MAPAGYWLQVELGRREQVWVLSPSVGTHPWVGKKAEVCRGWAAGGFSLRGSEVWIRAGRAELSAL